MSNASKKIIRLNKISSKNPAESNKSIKKKNQLKLFINKKDLAIFILIITIPLSFLLGMFVSYRTDFDSSIFGKYEHSYGFIYYNLNINRTESEIYLEIKDIKSSHFIDWSKFNINGISDWYFFSIDNNFNNVSILIDSQKYQFLNLGQDNINFIEVSIHNSLNLTIIKTIAFHI